MVGGDGIEPPEPMATDLQSAPLPTTEYPPKFMVERVGVEPTTSTLQG